MRLRACGAWASAQSRGPYGILGIGHRKDLRHHLRYLKT